MKKFYVTYHAVERLKERFGAFYSKIPELKNWTREQGLRGLKELFNTIIDSSIEDKSYLNNSKQMVFLYEKYGYDKEYKFFNFQEADIVLVLAKERSENDFRIVTLMPSAYKPVVNHTKHGKMSKEERLNKFVNSWNNRNTKINFKEANEEQKIIVPAQNIKNDLLKAKHNESALLLSQVSQTVSLNRYTIDNIEYDYYYSSTDKTVEIKSNRELTEVEIENINAEKNRKIANAKIYSIYSTGRAKLIEKIDAESSVYEVQIEDYMYKFEYNKSLGNLIILSQEKLQGELLKLYELSQENTFDFKEKILNNIKNNNYVMVKEFKNNVATMESTVDIYKYLFSYNGVTKEIVLKGKEPLYGKEEEISKLKSELTPPLLDTIKRLIHYNKVEFIKKLSSDISLNKFKNQNVEYEFTYNKKNAQIDLVNKIRM